ncbi:hypothetical protein DXG01_005997 [Tephrocybe rancida]|nr:hypothetical protein DXG01_005997 [Tephrocybe rancida]
MSDNSTHDYEAASKSMEVQEAARRRRSKRIVSLHLVPDHLGNSSLRIEVIGSIIVLAVLIAVAVAVGVTVSNKNKNKNLSKEASPSSPNPSGDTTSTPGNSTNGNSNDPSVFTKDPNLHKSFYGMAYTPEGSLMPNCGNSLTSVIKDIQAAPISTHDARSLLEAIKQTKVDMEVYVGNYVLPDDDASYTRQRDAIKDAIQTYGEDHIAGITVGNEFMLKYEDEQLAFVGAAKLIPYIKDTRDMLASLSLSKNIPVGNSDAGSYFNTEVLSAVDYGLSNVHAWFAHVTAEDAAGWVTTFFEDTNVKPAALLPNNPKMYIAETGWPTKSSDAASESNGAGTASIAGLQTFLDNFVCQANTNNIPYFYFEFFDEKWKDIQFGGVEGWWGLFNADRTLKDIKIPNCASP